MKQILMAKNSQIKEKSGSRVSFLYRSEDGEDLVITGDKVNAVRIPFTARILSGGTLDLDFALPESLARVGVSLLGAYWDGEVVTAYFRSLDNLDVRVKSGGEVLVGTLVQVVTFKQISDSLLGGIVNIEKSGPVLSLEQKPEKKRRGKKK